jgi:hypothetical protein
MSENDAHSPPKERKDFSNGRLIQLVEIERQKFDESTRTLTAKQNDAFDVWCDLLRENDRRLAKRSKERRSKRLRARALLEHVFTELGPEVFLLCTLATSITWLAEKPREDLVPDLRNWWTTVPHPQGLTKTANGELITELIATRTHQNLQIANDAGIQHLSRIP